MSKKILVVLTRKPNWSREEQAIRKRISHGLLLLLKTQGSSLDKIQPPAVPLPIY
jgi:hypothetical protein